MNDEESNDHKKADILAQIEENSKNTTDMSTQEKEEDHNNADTLANEKEEDANNKIISQYKNKPITEADIEHNQIDEIKYKLLAGADVNAKLNNVKYIIIKLHTSMMLYMFDESISCI